MERAVELKTPANCNVGLALSGGGIRAAVFHLGVLRCLADRQAMERVTSLSTVSGGSLIIAAVLTSAKMRWPDSAQYRDRIYPTLRELLTTRDLLSVRALGVTGVVRHNIRLLNGRADILVELLSKQWKINAVLSDLPEAPVWWINTTCIETGKNWRFSKREMGDWQFGRHYAPPFSLARAVAASAAVPYAIGALRFELPESGWYATDPATRKPLRPTKPPLNAVRLWDGGAYENLGLEPLYKPVSGLVDCDFLICSDASGPLMTASSPRHLRKMLQGRLASPRLFDIASDQIRSLRSRMFMGAIASGTVQGALIRMGNSIRNIDLKTGLQRRATEYDHFLSDDEAALASTYPTDLNVIEPKAFDRIARHGYEVANATLAAHSSSHFPSADVFRREML